MGGGLYGEHKTKTVFSESKFWHDLIENIKSPLDFLSEEVSEPEEMTDDDSDFSPLELKIKFTRWNFIQFTLIKLLFFLIQARGRRGAHTPEYTGIIRNGEIVKDVRNLRSYLFKSACFNSNWLITKKEH